MYYKAGEKKMSQKERVINNATIIIRVCVIKIKMKLHFGRKQKRCVSNCSFPTDVGTPPANVLIDFASFARFDPFDIKYS